MYLHIGNQKNIREKDIIGIFDADKTTTSWVTRKYLSEAQRRDLVKAANEEVPKSFVLYRDKRSGKCKVYFSQLSTAALVGRTGGITSKGQGHI
jgi:hypothetical protein